MSDENLKLQMEATASSIRSLKRMLLSCDAKVIRVALEQAEEAMRPMLYAMRTPEERQRQRDSDRLT